MSEAPNLNAWWCRALIAQLRAGGVRECWCAPGNRNLPLLAALVAEQRITLHFHADERAAAFAALGCCRASGRPVAMTCTSGTALAECLPAVCEADAARLPLLLLGADRPRRLRACGAPQTMPQAGIFTPFCRACLDLPDPVADPDLLDATLVTLAQALSTARIVDPGPVQINIPLDDPLPPLPDPTFQPPMMPAPRPLPAPPRLPNRLPDWCRPGRRGLIVVGPEPVLPPQAITHLAARCGFPILADPVGGGRACSSPLLCAHGSLVTCEAGLPAPDCLIRIGPAPLTRTVQAYCAQCPGPVLRMERGPVAGDFLHADFTTWIAPDDDELAALATALAPAAPGFASAWTAAAGRAAARLDATLAGADWDELSAAALVCAQSDGVLMLANSLSVRHGELVIGAHDERLTVTANRGVNGIDGTIATFAGLAAGRAGAKRLLIGDLAFFHDATALSLLPRRVPEARVIVLMNGGGRIFDRLPVAADPALLEILRCETAYDPLAFATACGCRARRCTDRASLRAALADDAPGPLVIVCTDFTTALETVLARLTAG